MKREEKLKNITKKFTKSYVDNLPIPATKNGKHTQKIYREHTLTGFAVRISSTGKKTFIIDKKSQRKLYRIILGKHGVITVENARKKAQKYLGLIAEGIDPRDAQKHERVIGTTLQDAFEAMLAARKDLKERTRLDYEKIIERDFSDWAVKPLTSISSEHVTVRHTKIGKRTRVGADNAFKLIRAIFNYAKAAYKDSKSESIIKVNPVDILSETRAWHGVRRRTNTIKIEQLPAWYQTVMGLTNDQKGSIATTVRDYLIAVLFMGDRKDELRPITWEDNIDFGAKTVQFFDTKNRLDLVLPMSDFLYGHFKKMKKNSSSRYVFPNADGTAPFYNPYKCIARVTRESKQYTKDGQPIKFTIHDLRRTFVTTADGLDLPAYTLKRLINHKMSSDVTAGYIITETERLREPMQRITDCLLAIFNGEFNSYSDYKRPA